MQKYTTILLDFDSLMTSINSKKYSDRKYYEKELAEQIRLLVPTYRIIGVSTHTRNDAIDFLFRNFKKDFEKSGIQNCEIYENIILPNLPNNCEPSMLFTELLKRIYLLSPTRFRKDEFVVISGNNNYIDKVLKNNIDCYYYNPFKTSLIDFYVINKISNLEQLNEYHKKYLEYSSVYINPSILSFLHENKQQPHFDFVQDIKDIPEITTKTNCKNLAITSNSNEIYTLQQDYHYPVCYIKSNEDIELPIKPKYEVEIEKIPNLVKRIRVV